MPFDGFETAEEAKTAYRRQAIDGFQQKLRHAEHHLIVRAGELGIQVNLDSPVLPFNDATMDKLYSEYVNTRDLIIKLEATDGAQ